MKKTVYSEEFYKEQMCASQISAQQIISVLLNIFHPKSVVDVGCGVGSWLIEFIKLGITDVVGIDGHYVKNELLKIPKSRLKSINLETSFKNVFDRKFDLAISLEVAEHLNIDNAENFIDSITSIADIVLFSGAIPYQGGTNHLNENWPEFWAILYKKKGFYPVDCIRPKIWYNKKVCWWYRQNILLFIKKEKLIELFPDYDFEHCIPLSFIHPELFLYSFARGKEEERRIYNRDRNNYISLIEHYAYNKNIPEKLISYNKIFDVQFEKSITSIIKNILLRLLSRQ